jgi:hypothetical protein
VAPRLLFWVAMNKVGSIAILVLLGSAASAKEASPDVWTSIADQVAAIPAGEHVPHLWDSRQGRALEYFEITNRRPNTLNVERFKNMITIRPDDRRQVPSAVRQYRVKGGKAVHVWTAKRDGLDERQMYKRVGDQMQRIGKFRVH